MSGAEQDLIYGLLAAGVLIVAMSTVAALATRRVYNRLHFLAPVTSIAGPLIGLALAIDNGPGLTTAEIIVIVAILAISGPVLEVATGRVSAQREGLIPQESPE